MPPKLKAKPKVVPRRGAAAPAAPEDPSASTPSASTPADPPTEPATPAAPSEPIETKPVPPPKGRLDSLTPSRPTSSLRAASTGLKFKPKPVARKTKEERDKVNAAFEAERAAADAAAAAPTRGRGGSRGERGARGGRGRGRGRGGGADMPSAASGPFALGSIVSGRQKVIAERGGDFRRSNKSFKYAKGGRVKAEGAEGEGVKAEYSSSDESDGERLDVEFISLLDEESDDEEKDDWGTGAPIRIPRIEHVDRQGMINTESSARKGKGVVEAARAKEMTFETDIKIKDEPEDEDVDMTAVPEKKKTTIKNGVEYDEFGEPMLPDLIPSPATIRRKKVRVSHSPDARRREGGPMRRRESGGRKKKPVITTTEEKEEYERREHDLLVTLRELGGALPEVEPKADPAVKAKTDEDGDVTMADQPEGSLPTEAIPAPPPPRNAETENQIFFFQFPTLLPQLTSAPAVKPEPTPVTAPTDPDAPPPPQKKPLSKKALYKSQLAALTDPPPSGLVGKMRVHKSGRISMLWGDPADDGHFVMEVNRGAQVEFLQEMVVMKEESPFGDEDKDEKGNRKGVAYSLGQVKGKYVVSPDFDRLIRDSDGGKKRGKGRGVEPMVVD